MKQILNLDLDEIIEIKSAGKLPVYDFVIPREHNFFANGILTHNSGAIEQDADLILFVYRDEVYNKAEDNPEKGIAEIAVSKNRHGALATIKTVFSGKYQKFYNIDKIPGYSGTDNHYGGDY